MSLPRGWWWAGLRQQPAARKALTCDPKDLKAARKFAALQAALDARLSAIGKQLARDPRQDAAAGGSPSEASIIDNLADAHAAFGSILRTVEAVCRENFDGNASADLLRALAEQHKKDADQLRALLWEDKRK
jgi:hypothetical protein